MLSFLWNKNITLYHWKNIFKNRDLNILNGYIYLQKYRSNIIIIVATISRIMDQYSNKDPHLTHLTCQDEAREPLRLFLQI